MQPPIHLMLSLFSGFPEPSLTDTLYSTPQSNVLVSDQSGYGAYDYCLMPHPRADLYEPLNGTLVRVEYVQRHQRRTPYNILPDDQFYCPSPNRDTRLNIVTGNSSTGTCQYPQLTDQGVLDAVAHGRDLWNIYGTMGFLPVRPDSSVGLRVSNSPLTEETAYGVLNGIWPNFDGQVHQMPSNEDTVNAGFSCAARDESTDDVHASEAWQDHLAQFNSTFEQFNLSGAWVASLDHLCDNFQAKMCNGYDTNVSNSTVNAVFAGGDWEWDYTWLRSSEATKLIKTTEGLFIDEIVARLRDGQGKYHHTFAHDGDIGPLAGALGITELRWPGMGSNIAIEIWEIEARQVVRVLYCGAPLRSTWVEPQHDLDDFLNKLGAFVLEPDSCN